MQPQRNEPLAVITQDSTSVAELQQLLKTTDHNGFPVVVSRESQYLVGFVLRRDLLLAVDNARARLESLPGARSGLLDLPKNRLLPSLCVFTHHVPVVGSGPPPIKLRKIVDLAPITITDQVLCVLGFSTSHPPDPHGDGGGHVPEAGPPADLGHPQWPASGDYHQERRAPVGSVAVGLAFHLNSMFQAHKVYGERRPRNSSFQLRHL